MDDIQKNMKNSYDVTITYYDVIFEKMMLYLESTHQEL